MSDMIENETIAEEVVVEAPKKRGRPPKAKPPSTSSSKSITITLDNTWDEVIQYDNEGYLIIFSGEPDSFLRLAEKQIKQLSPYNLGAYVVAERGHRDAVKHRDNPTFLKYGDVNQYAHPVDQLSVSGKDPSMHYAWKRPDQLRRADMKGWKVDHDDNLDTFNHDVSSVHTVGAVDREGGTELILHKMPVENYEAMKAASREKSEVMREGVQKAAVASIKGGDQSGRGTVYVPDDEPRDSGHPWTDTADG